MLDERIAQELRDLHERWVSDGRVPSAERLAGWHGAFRERFGPERLARLDGEALLSTMHEHGNHDSLVYWLEFKDDEEFPDTFGSIAGGSALKFGIYRRKETGQWMTGSPQKQIVLTTEQAVEVARRNRDQLIRAAALLEKLPGQADDLAYQMLQADLEREAPDIQNTAWGHKYLVLLFPDKLDDYHVASFQRYHLIRLLQLPPAGDGRYICAGRFLAIAREVGITVWQLTNLLNERNGRPRQYWRIGTSDGSEPMNRWPPMLNGNYVAIGWSELGDLSELTYDQASKDRLRELASRRYNMAPQGIGNLVPQVLNFAAGIRTGDLVIAASGAKMLAIGRVKGGYIHDESAPADFPHRRPVEWLHVGEFRLPVDEGLQSTVRVLGRHQENLVAIEKQLFNAVVPLPPSPPLPPPGKVEQKHTIPLLSGTPGSVQSVLERKGQVILYGPPGTGKTHWAELTARDLAAYATYGVPFANLQPEQHGVIIGETGKPGLVRMCTFHPAYGYEDFLEGYRPAGSAGGFELRSGIFKRLCADAAAQPDQRFYLIIDEINRGDIPRIFGELLTVLEKSKRGRPVILPLSGEAFAIPPNIYVMGTMNTADRSIALLDTALRRRFGFVELMPDSTVLGDATVDGVPLGPWLEALNGFILEHVGRDARNLQIGHSYLLEGVRPISDQERFARVLREDIVPLLEEYCYEDYELLEKILGKSLVDLKLRRIKHELFAPASWPALRAALLKMAPELATAPEVVATETPEPDGPKPADEDGVSGDN